MLREFARPAHRDKGRLERPAGSIGPATISRTEPDPLERCSDFLQEELPDLAERPRRWAEETVRWVAQPDSLAEQIDPAPQGTGTSSERRPSRKPANKSS